MAEVCLFIKKYAAYLNLLLKIPKSVLSGYYTRVTLKLQRGVTACSKYLLLQQYGGTICLAVTHPRPADEVWLALASSSLFLVVV